MPGLFVAVVAAGRDELVHYLWQVVLQAGLELNRAHTAAVLPTLKICTIPVLIPDEFTIAATSSVRSYIFPCHFAVREICRWKVIGLDEMSEAIENHKLLSANGQVQQTTQYCTIGTAFPEKSTPTP
jgi:hypothetical protein